MSETTTVQNQETKTPAAASGNAGIYQTTSEYSRIVTDAFPFYGELMAAFAKGQGTVELRKRYILRAIDELWVRAFEDAIPSIDTIIRNPGRLLQEEEALLPVEQTRKVTSRSVQHLSQHTDLINEIRADGTVMPSKLLNVFQDETILTYENKFINTLLSRMYGFVIRRYESACECGEDEKTTRLSLVQSFGNEDSSGKISLTIEMTEKPGEHEVVKNYIYSSDLWRRVENVYKIVTKYMDSDFVRELGKAYVRPPIIRTNKLLKNVEFRQCLTLWEFLEQYDNTGYETLVQENLETVDEDCLKDLYNTIAMQYVIFKNKIDAAFSEENTLSTRVTEQVIKPKIVEEFDPFEERELDQRDLIPAAEPEEKVELIGLEDEIEEAIRVALEADDFFIFEECKGSFGGKIIYRYRYSFLSRLVLAQDPVQNFYTMLKNELLSYKKVRSKVSWGYDQFMLGRNKCARINVKGKTLYLYLPLDPAEFKNGKFKASEPSASIKKQGFTYLLKVRSPRGAKYACEMIRAVLEKYSAVKNEAFTETDYHMPSMTAEEMAQLPEPLVKLVETSDFYDPERSAR